jgi:hypothetical protein
LTTLVTSQNKHGGAQPDDYVTLAVAAIHDRRLKSLGKFQRASLGTFKHAPTRVCIVGSWWLIDDAIHALFAIEAKRFMTYGMHLGWSAEMRLRQLTQALWQDGDGQLALIGSTFGKFTEGQSSPCYGGRQICITMLAVAVWVGAQNCASSLRNLLAGCTVGNP